MNANRVRTIQQLLEACRETDNSQSEAEKTAVIAELLAEIDKEKDHKWRMVMICAMVMAVFSLFLK
jgi:hypothetical protein